MNIKITLIFHEHKNFDNKLISNAFEEPLKGMRDDLNSAKFDFFI